MITAQRREVLGGAFGLAGTLPAVSRDQVLADDLGTSFDRYFHALITAFPDQPGFAAAAVRDGQVVFAGGYGVLRLGLAEPVTEHTVFDVASNTKAFTTAALALLADDGRVGWDTPVTDYLPSFAMSDPGVTRMITVRDLLAHRSGLGLGAGDLMMYPRTTHSRDEVVHALRYLPLKHGFRAQYAYDNVLYIVAGEVVRAVSGASWEDFVRERLLRPIGMTDSATEFLALPDNLSLAWPHARLGPPSRGAGPVAALEGHSDVVLAAAAGGLWSSAADMARWMIVQLAGGRLPDGGRLWSPQAAQEMWRPQVIVGAHHEPTKQRPERSGIRTYALGWIVETFRGRRLVWHSGNAPGATSMTLMLPGANCGLVILANSESPGLMFAAKCGGLDLLLGCRDVDWIAKGVELEQLALEEAASPAPTTRPPESPVPASLPISAFVGTYRDSWYGDIKISKVEDRLEIIFQKTPKFEGPLFHFDGDSFITRWPDLNIENAIFRFTIEDGEVLSALVEKANPNADFSYDFEDLRLAKIS